MEMDFEFQFFLENNKIKDIKIPKAGLKIR
jgi:hypothetical protein